MNRKILIAIVASVGLTMFFACSQKNPKQEQVEETKVAEVKEENMEIDGFTIISADKDHVKLKIAAGKTLYDVTLIAGSQSFAFQQISNESGDLKMPNGATAWAGSNLIHPERLGFDSFLFPDGATVRVFTFEVAEDFKPEKVHIIPKKGDTAIEFNLKP